MYMDHYVLCAAFVYLTNTQHTFHTFDRTTHTRSKNIMHYKYRGTPSGAVSDITGVVSRIIQLPNYSGRLFRQLTF